MIESGLFDSCSNVGIKSLSRSRKLEYVQLDE